MTATSELHELATKKGVRVDFKFLEPFNFEFKHSMRMWNKKEMLGNYRWVEMLLTMPYSLPTYPGCS